MIDVVRKALLGSGLVVNLATADEVAPQAAGQAATGSNEIDWLQAAGDFSAAFGSAVSFGLTDVINNATGASSFVNRDSGWFIAGEVTGFAVAMVVSGGGAEAELGETELAAERAGAAARTFTSPDPLVADLANEIEAAYPGHVVGVNVPLLNAAGEEKEIDILLKNAVIEVKSGRGAGLTSQLAKAQALTDLPVIGYGPQLGVHVVRGIRAAGGLVTRDAQLLIDVVAP
jgi:hypothetical protein